jgi:cytochrome c
MVGVSSMKLILISGALALAAASVLIGGAARAQDVPKKCMGCHDVEKKKVGPAFKDAAAKHKGDKGAADAIVAKMKAGKGHPKVSGSDDELKAAVTAALSK